VSIIVLEIMGGEMYPQPGLARALSSTTLAAMRTPLRPSHAALLALVALSACEPAPVAAPVVSPVPTQAAAQAIPAPPSSPPPPVAAALPAKDPLVVDVVVPEALRAVVLASDRLDVDRQLDKGRHPAEILAFLGAAPGMRVAELGSYQGYMADLLGRAVAPTGKVYAQDPASLNKFTKPNWAARAKSPAMKTIVRVERPFDDPLAPDLRDLDAVVCGLFYHDLVWLKIDRPKLNAAVFRALKPGGVFLVYDHAAREGSGTDDAKTLHRIEEKVARAEIEAAGFKLAATASFLRNPTDKMDWNASDEGPKELRGTSDRFVHKYVKP